MMLNNCDVGSKTNVNLKLRLQLRKKDSLLPLLDGKTTVCGHVGFTVDMKPKDILDILKYVKHLQCVCL